MVQHVAGGLHLAIGAAFGVEEEEFKLESPCRVQAFGGKRVDLALQRMAGEIGRASCRERV